MKKFIEPKAEILYFDFQDNTNAGGENEVGVSTLNVTPIWGVDDWSKNEWEDLPQD